MHERCVSSPSDDVCGACGRFAGQGQRSFPHTRISWRASGAARSRASRPESRVTARVEQRAVEGFVGSTRLRNAGYVTEWECAGDWSDEDRGKAARRRKGPRPWPSGCCSPRGVRARRARSDAPDAAPGEAPGWRSGRTAFRNTPWTRGPGRPVPAARGPACLYRIEGEQVPYFTQTSSFPGSLPVSRYRLTLVSTHAFPYSPYNACRLAPLRVRRRELGSWSWRATLPR